MAPRSDEQRKYDREYKRRWRLENPELAKQQDRERYQAQRERRLAYQREYRKQNPEKVLEANRNSYNTSEKQRRSVKERRLQRLYGLTLTEAETMLAAQEGGCAICRRPVSFDPGPDKRPTAFVDHCHTTNRIRGILCHACNTGLGCFYDTPTALESAVEYLLDTWCRGEST